MPTIGRVGMTNLSFPVLANLHCRGMARVIYSATPPRPAHHRQRKGRAWCFLRLGWCRLTLPGLVLRAYQQRSTAYKPTSGGSMATIRDLLNNRTIHYIQPEQTVFEAANYMVSCNVGAVPVLDGTRLVGIFSERDIMRRVVTEGRDPLVTRIADVMSTRLSTVSPGDSSEEAMA